MRAAAPLPRPKPGHVPVGHAGHRGCGGAVGRAAAGGRGLPRHPRGRRQDRGAAAPEPRGRAPEPRHRGGRGGVRHGGRRRRAGRARGGGVRRVGRAAHDRDRARGPRRPGGHVVADRELPRLPVGRVRRRAGRPRPAPGAQARGRDPRHPLDHAHRSGDPAGAPGRRRRAEREDDRPRLRRLVAAAVRSRGSTGWSARASATARRAARRRTRTASTSTSSARATRRARRRCSSRAMRAP